MDRIALSKETKRMVKLSDQVIRAHIGAQNNPGTSAATNKPPARQRKRLIEAEFYNTVLDTMLQEITSAGGNLEENTRQEDGNNPNANDNFLFCCPITKKPLQDPVVAPDGISYERSAVPVCEEPLYYPNRILKLIITESEGQQPLSVTTNLLQKALVNDNTDERESQIADAIEKLLQEMSSLPEAYYCPITFRPMRDPVIDPEGNTFERTALVSWLEEKGTSPITRNPVNVDDLYPNTTVSLSHSLKQLKESLELWRDTNRERDIEFVKEIVSLCGVTQEGDSIANSRGADADAVSSSSSSASFSSSRPPSSTSRMENFFVTTFPDDIDEFPGEMESLSSPNSDTASTSRSPTRRSSDMSSVSYDSTYYSTGTDGVSTHSSSSTSSSETSSTVIAPRDVTDDIPSEFSRELSQTSGISSLSVATSSDDIHQSRSSVSSTASSSSSQPSSSSAELSSAPLSLPRPRRRSQRWKRWWRKITTTTIRRKLRRAKWRVRNTIQRINSLSQHDISRLAKRQCKFLLSLVIGLLVLAVSPVIAIVALLLLLLSGCS